MPNGMDTFTVLRQDPFSVSISTGPIETWYSRAGSAMKDGTGSVSAKAPPEIILRGTGGKPGTQV